MKRLEFLIADITHRLSNQFKATSQCWKNNKHIPKKLQMTQELSEKDMNDHPHSKASKTFYIEFRIASEELNNAVSDLVINWEPSFIRRGKDEVLKIKE